MKIPCYRRVMLFPECKNSPKSILFSELLNVTCAPILLVAATEAINSMFCWYPGAENCYAYLTNVSTLPSQALMKPSPGYPHWKRWMNDSSELDSGGLLAVDAGVESRVW